MSKRRVAGWASVVRRISMLDMARCLCDRRIVLVSASRSAASSSVRGRNLDKVGQHASDYGGANEIMKEVIGRAQ